MEKRAFDFIKINELAAKPRAKGVVEIRGSYYSPVTYTYLKDLFELCGDYIDGFKFVAGCQRFHTPKMIKKFTKLCHKHDIYVSTGGFIERVIIQGKDAVDQYLKETKNLGFDVLEVSSGFASIPFQDQIEIIKKASAMGLKVKPEISFMVGTGGGTHKANYKIKYKPVDKLLQEAKAYLEAGAYKLMLESEGITEDLPQKKWRTDIIKKAVDAVGIDKWMFEASDPVVFKWYLQNFGQDVNVFIDHSQIFEFNAWRAGLWGNPDIWKDKPVNYLSPAPQTSQLPDLAVQASGSPGAAKSSSSK